MLKEMRKRFPRFSIFWEVFTNVATILTISLLASFFFVSTVTRNDGPVVRVSDVKVLTPQVEAGGEVVFSVWRESFESCPGEVVTSYFLEDQGDEDPSIVTSIRRPLATPGFNSPPRLTIRATVPSSLLPGKYLVRVGVDSYCPSRKQFDATHEFQLEVVRAKSDS